MQVVRFASPCRGFRAFSFVLSRWESRVFAEVRRRFLLKPDGDSCASPTAILAQVRRRILLESDGDFDWSSVVSYPTYAGVHPRGVLGNLGVEVRNHDVV